MTDCHRHHAEGAIKKPVSTVTEAVGNHCQEQVPMGQSCNYMAEQIDLMTDSEHWS